MIKIPRLPAILLSTALSLFSLDASAIYLAQAVCVGVGDGGIGFTTASCYDQHATGAWVSSASADLPTGQISAHAYTDNSTSSTQMPNAAIEDVITINGLPATDSVYLGAYLNVTGSIAGDPVDSFRFAYADIELASTDFSIDNFAAIDLFYDGTSVITDSTNSYGNYQLIVNSLTPTGFDITLQTWFTVPGSDPNASVIANVGAVSWPETATVGVTSDISGSLSIEILNGYTFNSESGVLLSQVPILPSVWLFGSGLLGLIGVARRKAA
jgi:hypothetical protein